MKTKHNFVFNFILLFSLASHAQVNFSASNVHVMKTNNLKTIDLNQDTSSIYFKGSDQPIKNPERGYSVRAGVVDIKPQGYKNFIIRMYDEDGWNFFHQEYNDMDHVEIPIGYLKNTFHLRNLESWRQAFGKRVSGDFEVKFYAQGDVTHRFSLFGLAPEATKGDWISNKYKKYAFEFTKKKVQIDAVSGLSASPVSNAYYVDAQVVHKYEIKRKSDTIRYFIDGQEIYLYTGGNPANKIYHISSEDLYLYTSSLYTASSNTDFKVYDVYVNDERISLSDFTIGDGTYPINSKGSSEIMIEVSTKGDNSEIITIKLKENEKSGKYEVVKSHKYLSYDTDNQSVMFRYTDQMANHYTDLEGGIKNSGYHYQDMNSYLQKFGKDSISLMELESYVYFTDKQLENPNISYQNLSALSEKINKLSKKNGVKLQLTLNSDFIFQNKVVDKPTHADINNFNLTPQRSRGLHNVMQQINDAFYKNIRPYVATAQLGWFYMPHNNPRYRDSNHWKNAKYIYQYYPYDHTAGDNMVLYNSLPINNYHEELRESVQKDDWHYHVLGGNNIDYKDSSRVQFNRFRNNVFQRTVDVFPDQKILLRSVMPIRAFDKDAFRAKAPYGYSDVAFGYCYGHETTIGSAQVEGMKWGPNDSDLLGVDFGTRLYNTNGYSLRRYRNNFWIHGRLAPFESENNYKEKTGVWKVESNSKFSSYDPEEFFKMINGEEQENKAGLYAAFKLRLFNYTSFNITRNNLLDGRCPYENPDETGTTVIQRWKKETLNKATAESFGLTFSEGYFDRGSRSVYDYIRDHLGYRLEVQKMDAKKLNPSSLQVTVEIQNKGFAAPQLKRKIYLVLLNDKNQPVITKNNETVQLKLLNEDGKPVDWRDWQPTLFSNGKTKDSYGNIIDLKTNTWESDDRSSDCDFSDVNNTMDQCLVSGIPLGRNKSEWYKNKTPVIPEEAKEYYTYALKTTVGVLDQLEDGKYKLALWLPDSNNELQNQKDYAVKFANSNIEIGFRGENILAQFTIGKPEEPIITDKKISLVEAKGRVFLWDDVNNKIPLAKTDLSGNQVYIYKTPIGRYSDEKGKIKKSNIKNELNDMNVKRPFYLRKDFENDNNEYSMKEVLLYPVPIKNELNIKLNKRIKNACIKIYSMTGNLVYGKSHLSLNNGYGLISSLKSLPSGNYVMKIRHKNGIISKTMIKE